MARPLLICAAVLCLAFGPAACDDDDDATVTETETTDTSGDAPPPPTAAGTEGPEFFSSPSGNIGCSVAKQGVRCDIGKRDWKATPPPEPCELDYGNGISLGADGAQFTCAGDTALGAPDVLEYGQRAQRGNFFCDSAQDGITCSDLRTGTGFFISRESYRIF